MKDIQGRLRVRVAVFACVAAVALGVDQLTKMWAQQALGRRAYSAADAWLVFVDAGS